MKSIKIYARFLEAFCLLIVMPLIAISYLLRWLMATSSIAYLTYTSHTGIFYSLNFSTSTLSTIPFISQLLGALIDGVSFALLFWGGFWFIKLLRCYKRGEIFSAYTLLLCKKISKIAFLWTVYAPIKMSLLNLLFTLHLPPGQRELALVISANDITNIFVVGFFLIMTSLMHEGYQLKHEHDLTI